MAKLQKQISQKPEPARPQENTMRNLRHYYATNLYDKTKDILLVQARLGHKKIEATLFYTQLISLNEEEEYTCKAAANAQEAMTLIEAGFQYLTTIGVSVVKLHLPADWYAIPIRFINSRTLSYSLRYCLPFSVSCREVSS